MVVALGALMAACVGFRVVPTVLLAHVFAPAAGAWLAGAQYGHNLLAGAGPLPTARVPFDYLSLPELATVAVTVIRVVPIARGARAAAGTRAVRLVRAVQSGSANDYATYLVAGLIVRAATLTLR